MKRFKWLSVVMIVSLVLVLSCFANAIDMKKGIGDIPLDKATYQKYLKELTVKALPVSYDARDDGIVTPPKDQGACGSCWAFASAGAFESHLLKEYGYGPTDLSEQEQVSCNTAMSGCCGGSAEALRFWESQGPIKEDCFPYAEAYTSCPIQRTKPCSGSSDCTKLLYLVTNYHTVDASSTAQVKTSVYDEGPSYFRYNFYNDFRDYWQYGDPGEVYVNSSNSTLEGGHAILIIGWNDKKSAYLCKNSWGATGGPNGDGTFWMAYSGHAHNLNFGMANFSLSAPLNGQQSMIRCSVMLIQETLFRC